MTTNLKTLWGAVRRPALVVLALAGLAGASCAGVSEYVWYDPAKTNGQHSGFTIAPGDMLQVTVWQQEDLSAQTRVRSDGFITVPLVGELEVVGKTPADVGVQIGAALEGVILEPRVAVMVVEAQPLRVGVLGAVERPGFYELDRGSGILQALAQAGGLNAFADRERIFIVRGDSKPVRFSFNDIVSGRAAYVLGPTDTVLVE